MTRACRRTSCRPTAARPGAPLLTTARSTGPSPMSMTSVCPEWPPSSVFTAMRCAPGIPLSIEDLMRSDNQWSCASISPMFTTIPRHSHRQAAVYGQHDPSDVGGLIRCEKADRGADLARMGEATEGHLTGQLVLLVGWDTCHHRRLGIRRDGVHGYAKRCDLLGDRLREADDAGFGSRVIGLTEVAVHARVRRHV